MASTEAFAVASVQLCSMLWADLELVVASRTAANMSFPPPESAAVRLQILRLELVLLIDACDSECWRTHLSSVQLRALHGLLQDVLDTLAGADDEYWASSIECAQDQLLDAVLGQCPVPSELHASRPLISAAS